MAHHNVPYTRSRTNLFLSYRDSSSRPSLAASSSASYYATPDLESRALLDDVADATPMLGSSASFGGAGHSGLPPKWVDVSEKVDVVLSGVKPKLDKLDKLHAKHLLPGFKDRSAEEREIESLASSITSDFRQCQNHIRHIAKLSASLLNDRTTSRPELIMAANVQTALATKVQDVSGVFRRKQTAYLRRLKGAASPMPGTPSASSSPTTFSFSGNPLQDPILSLNSDASYASQTLSQTQSLLPPSSSSAHAIDTRTTEIVALAQSIQDLSGLFTDLQGLVLDQGTVLDRVDWNVEQMKGEVMEAGRELKIAGGRQRRSGKCQLIFLLVLLIVGAIVLLTFRPSHRFSSSPSPTTPSETRPTEGSVDSVAELEENEKYGDDLLDEDGAERRRRRAKSEARGWRPRGRRRAV